MTARRVTRPPAPKPPFRVGVTSLRIVEAATPGSANGQTATGQPIRILPTVIRYPAQGTPSRGGPVAGAPAVRAAGAFPLIVFSQGYDYPAQGYSVLLDAWARAGYVVAAPTYPFTDPATPGGPHESDIVNHPADLRHVISRLLAAGRRASGPLHGLIDGGRVALVGQSDGGDVTLATAANTCCQDPRVRAAVTLSGAELAAFGGTYYANGSPPLLVVQGDADTINVPGCSAQLYDQAPEPKYYVDLLGEQHLPAYVSPGRDDDVVRAAVLNFLAFYLQGRHSGLAGLRRAAEVPGVATLTSAPTVAAPSTSCPGAP